MGKRGVHIVERLLSSIELGDNGCWNWTGRLTPDGYGQISFRLSSNEPVRSRPASRASYEVFVGDPGHLFVCHHCDNPKCINPEHLYAGTHLENMRDRTRRAPQVGENNPAARLSSDNVALIRSSDLTATTLAAKLGVGLKTVCDVRNRVTWKHLP